MTYLVDFRTQINNRDFSKFLQLWEEYCTSDHVDSEEFIELLKSIKNSDFAKPFGKLVETALPLWQTIKDKNESYNVLKALIDLQATNSPQLATIAFDALKERYGNQPEFNERVRLVGLRTRENFQGSLANYDLLSHMDKGRFVFHAGGWGAGEIVDISQVRQQLTIEFENVSGRKHLTFDNAFKSLIPLENGHFLVRRFANPDQLEQEARDNPVEIIKMLLKDLGPKTAGEIKDELCELVIPEADWTKWWQGVRARLKKDPIIEAPESLRDSFSLRKTEISNEERLHKAIEGKTELDDIIQSSYNFVRDLPSLKQNSDVKNSLRDKLISELKNATMSPEQELQIILLLEGQFGHRVDDRSAEGIVKQLKNPESIINAIEIIALKKRILVLIREHRKDWVELFLSMMRSVKQSNLRDYILKELNEGENKAKFSAELSKIMHHPQQAPELIVWYFQKIVSDEKDHLSFSDKEGQCQFFESFLVLFSYLENKPEHRDLLKKMYNLLSGKRFAIVRSIMAGASLEFIKEFLLLASKCQSISDQDIKILHSLSEVAHPSLSKGRSKTSLIDPHTIWTTESSLMKIQEQVRQIGTVDIVENAREIEAARALGDLRENSEFKFALEKRSRLQGQLKMLSDQIHHARVITQDDIHTEEVAVGNVVKVVDPRGKTTSYTILGPWDANADDNILSFQSKLAQAMIGCKIGDTFQFRDEEYTIAAISSYFDRQLNFS